MLNVITFVKINKITLRNRVSLHLETTRRAEKINQLDNGNLDYRKSDKVLSWILQFSLTQSWLR